MPRKLRYVPTVGTLIETTCRVLQGRMLLSPSRLLNESIVGTLAVAKERFGVEIVCVVVLSNHLHLLLKVANAQQLASFQCYVSSNIAREVGRLTGWREKVWGRRYTAIPVSEEPAAQIARLRYLLSHGVKEGLVERCVDWPGVHSAEALTSGQEMQGFWFDRTAEYNARRRGEDCGTYAFASPQSLELTPLPCWQDLDPAEYQQKVAEMIQEIEQEARRERRRQGIAALGSKMILRQDPFTKPPPITRTPTPWIHAACRAVRESFRRGYLAFEQAYREAASRLVEGDLGVCFPPGCFPPALRFVDL